MTSIYSSSYHIVVHFCCVILVCYLVTHFYLAFIVTGMAIIRFVHKIMQIKLVKWLVVFGYYLITCEKITRFDPLEICCFGVLWIVWHTYWFYTLVKMILGQLAQKCKMWKYSKSVWTFRISWKINIFQAKKKWK